MPLQITTDTAACCFSCCQLITTVPFSLVAATLNLMMALPPEKRACVTKWISCFKMGALVEKGYRVIGPSNMF